MTDVDEAARSVWPLGKYLILAELGRGGMAEVYLALVRGPNRFTKLVVLKLLRAHLAEDEEFLEMFVAEARLAAMLNHPNVVQTYEIGVEGGRHCIVMEYLEGRSLAEIEHVTRLIKLPVMLGARILADALGGLHYAHDLVDIDGRRLDLVHRDISPHNIFVTYDGQVKVLDFGIAKAVNTGTRTKTGVFKGKIRYMAPERFSGDETDRRSDLFSFGVMLWQLLAGKRMWAGLNDMGIMHQLSSNLPIPRPSALRANVSARLEAICMKALAHDPKKRFQSASELQDALEDVLSTESVGTSNRALTKFMTETFGAAREHFQKVVDEQIRVAASLPDDATPSVSRLRMEGVPVLGRGAPSSGSLSVSGGMAAALPVLSSMAPAMRSASPPPVKPGRSWSALGVVALVVMTAAIAIFAGGPRAPEPRDDHAAAGRPPPSASEIVSVPAVTAVTPAKSASSPAAPAVRAAVDEVDASPKRAAAPTPTPAPPRSMSSPRARPVAPITEPPRAASPPPRPEPRHEPDCTSPYFVDDEGTKKIRPECL
jgi:serine/threonine-protein kinase